MADPAFRYVAQEAIVVDGVPARGMTVWAATGRRLGRLRGFILDATQQRIRYVVTASGLFGKATVVPFSTGRIDVDRRAIELDLDERDLWKLRGLTPEALLT